MIIIKMSDNNNHEDDYNHDECDHVDGGDDNQNKYESICLTIIYLFHKLFSS